MSKKSAVVSGAGLAAAFWVALDKAVRALGVSEEDFHAAVKDESPLIEEFAHLIAGKRSTVKVKRFRITLNYGDALEAKGASGFGYCNPNLTDKNFTRIAGMGRINAEAVLVYFGKFISTDEEALSLLDGMGLRAGIPKELADLSKSHPDSCELASCFPIAALGDSWRDPHGSRHVAYLNGHASNRNLDLHYSGGWDDGWWFLAFHK